MSKEPLVIVITRKPFKIKEFDKASISHMIVQISHNISEDNSLIALKINTLSIINYLNYFTINNTIISNAKLLKCDNYFMSMVSSMITHLQMQTLVETFDFTLSRLAGIIQRFGLCCEGKSGSKDEDHD